MDAGDEALARIAAALERLAPPPPPPTDWRAAPAYVWDGERVRAVPVLDALPLTARALGRELAHDARAKTRAAAGDHGNLALQSHQDVSNRLWKGSRCFQR